MGRARAPDIHDFCYILLVGSRGIVPTDRENSGASKVIDNNKRQSLKYPRFYFRRKWTSLQTARI